MSDETTQDCTRGAVPSHESVSPDSIVHTARASLRATEVYARALSDRFELTHATNPTPLYEIPDDFLLHVIAVSDAFQSGARRTLWYIEPELARSAEVIAGLARDGAGVPSLGSKD